MNEPIHDVLIIGAGPCGLAVAARLCEHTPSALFTDDEHQRYHWIRRHSGKMAIKNRKNGRTAEVNQPCNPRHSIIVLDESGDEWLARWNRLFDVFDIAHLRSPMFFHVDPRDRDGLLEFAHMCGRQHECCEIGGCVGKERSKHHKKRDRKKAGLREPAVDERDRKDYYTPSRELFADQCRQIVDHYCLRHTPIMRERVEDIDYSNCGTEDGSHSFTIRTNKQQVYRARVVVLAVGHGASPTIPGLLAGQRIDGACHAMQIAEFPDPTLKAKVAQGQTTNVLVVGGGLTSAQIADLAIRRGVTKVWHLMRSGLKVKPFDLGLEWLGKFRNVEQSAFWSADSDEERLEQIRTARNGGSITPKYLKVLRDHVAKGALSLFTNTVVTSRSWDSRSRRWTVTTEPNHDLPPMDYIYYATGMKPDVHSVPFLQTILRKYPIQTCGGLPCINHDLMWNNQVPLLITGGLGALRIGPGAANLSGARSAAERVAWSIADLLPQREEDEDGVKSYHLGIGSRFVALDGN